MKRYRSPSVLVEDMYGQAQRTQTVIKESILTVLFLKSSPKLAGTNYDRSGDGKTPTVIISENISMLA